MTGKKDWHAMRWETREGCRKYERGHGGVRKGGKWNVTELWVVGKKVKVRSRV